MYTKDIEIKQKYNEIYSSVHVDSGIALNLIKELSVLENNNTPLILKGKNAKIVIKRKKDDGVRSVLENYYETENKVSLLISENDIDFFRASLLSFVKNGTFPVNHIDIEFKGPAKLLFGLIIQFSKFIEPISGEDLTNLIINDE